MQSSKQHKKLTSKSPQQPRKLNSRKMSTSTPFQSPYTNARKIICVGRNFADHAKELGNAVPTEPVLFLKPPSSLIMEADTTNNKIEIPPGCSNLHHEVELGIIIGGKDIGPRGVRNVKKEDANQYISGYFLGLDMTARELQEKAKKGGLPWSVSKGFDTFAPISPVISKDSIKDTTKLRLTLDVNGKRKQDGTTDLMLFPVDSIIAYASTIFTLEEGDLIYTGTPAGVGPVVENDVIKCELLDTVTNQLISQIQFSVINRPTVMAKL